MPRYNKIGFRNRNIDANCTMATVIGWGNFDKIVLLTIALLEEMIYQRRHKTRTINSFFGSSEFAMLESGNCQGPICGLNMTRNYRDYSYCGDCLQRKSWKGWKFVDNIDQNFFPAGLSHVICLRRVEVMILLGFSDRHQAQPIRKMFTFFFSLSSFMPTIHVGIKINDFFLQTIR